MTQVLHCPYCDGMDIVRHGTTPEGKQRYRCRECVQGRGRTFLLEYVYAGQSLDIKRQSVNRSVVVWIVAMHPACRATDNTGKPALPHVTTRKPHSADGAVSTRHLQHFACVLYDEHGRACEGCEEGRRVGKGDPNEHSKTQQAVGWGIGVRARESRAQQDQDCRRRRLA